MPDARWGRAQQPAAHRAGPALGLASPLCAGSRATRPAMRWLWPLGISLAMALAAGPERAPQGVRLQQGGHQPAAQEQLDRSRRGAEREHAKGLQQYVPEGWAEYPRPIRPAAPQPTQAWVAASPSPDRARATGGSGQEPRGNVTGPPGWRLQVQNPLYPVTEHSYGAYAVLLLALLLFAVGIVGSLAVMCIVWHSYYLKSAWNSILASLALWDFLVLFFCLPVVTFHEITKQRLLGAVSCRAVPFVEVSVWPGRAHGAGAGGCQHGRRVREAPQACLTSPPGWSGRHMQLSGPPAPQPGSRLQQPQGGPLLSTLRAPSPALTPLSSHPRNGSVLCPLSAPQFPAASIGARREIPIPCRAPPP